MTSFFSSVQPMSGFEVGPHCTLLVGFAWYEREAAPFVEACDSALFHGSVAILLFTKSSMA